MRPLNRLKGRLVFVLCRFIARLSLATPFAKSTSLVAEKVHKVVQK